MISEVDWGENYFYLKGKWLERTFPIKNDVYSSETGEWYEVEIKREFMDGEIDVTLFEDKDFLYDNS